jgi:hypothetical protein
LRAPAAYTVAARKSNETPAWQSAASRGDVKVYTELAEAPRTIAGFTDSITIDIVESGARAWARSPACRRAAARAARAGPVRRPPRRSVGLSTLAIVGGVVAAGRHRRGRGRLVAEAAGAAAQAAAQRPHRPASFAGNWSGTQRHHEFSTAAGTRDVQRDHALSRHGEFANQFNGTTEQRAGELLVVPPSRRSRSR